MSNLHPELRKNMRIPLVGSIALALAGLAMLVILAEAPSILPRPHGLFLLLAIFFLGIAYLGLVIAPRWYRRSSKLVTWVAPVQGRIVLQKVAGSSATSLSAAFVNDAAQRRHRYLVFTPPWPVEPLLGTPLEVAVYRDPRTEGPVAFQIPQGLLWCVVYTPHAATARG